MPNRDPSSSANAPMAIGRSGTTPREPEHVHRREGGDHAERPVVRPTVEDRVEVGADQQRVTVG